VNIFYNSLEVAKTKALYICFCDELLLPVLHMMWFVQHCIMYYLYSIIITILPFMNKFAGYISYSYIIVYLMSIFSVTYILGK